MKRLFRVLTVVVSCLLPGSGFAWADGATPPAPDGLFATFHTAKGDIVAKLYFEKAPMTVASFVGLAEGALPSGDGKKYFDGLTFHRVVPGFVVQGGDPLGTGEGRPGYAFPDELVPGLRHDKVGVLSMANAGPDSNGSQFFFTLAPVNRLNYLHSVFGQVIQGLEVLPKIEQGDRFSVTIERRGAAAEAFRVTKESFAAWVDRAPKAVPPHFADPEAVLPLDPPRAKGFDNKLANFERFTGQKLYARLFPTMDPADRELKPGRVAKRLAEEIGVAQDGVVVAYWVEQDVWGLWLSDSWVPRFVPAGTSATTPLHERKQKLFKDATERAAANIAKAEAAGQTLTDGQKVKARIDEVVDALIEIMESAPRSP